MVDGSPTTLCYNLKIGASEEKILTEERFPYQTIAWSKSGENCLVVYLSHLPSSLGCCSSKGWHVILSLSGLAVN